MRLLPAIVLLLGTAFSVVAETKLRVIGTESLSEQEVLEFIGGRLDHIRDQPATPSRAADAAFLVEQLFQRNGFNEAAVSWKILASDLIRIRIHEGPLDLLGTVTIEGIPSEELSEKLVKLFELGPSKRRIGVGRRPPVRDEDREAGVELMRRELQSLSFWKAEIAVTRWERNPDTGHIDATVSIQPGRAHKLARPVFNGPATPTLRELANAFAGRPANTANINELRLDVIEYYRSRGFVNAKVKMNLEMREAIVLPVFTVTKGQRYRLGKVAFEGLGKTRPERIACRLEGLTGHYIDGREVDRRIRQLVATGAFSTVETKTTARDTEILDATLHFTEADARGISLTGGFDSYEGPLLGASYYDRNFRGGIRNLSTGFEITGRSLLGEVSLADPWILGSDVSGRLRLFSLQRSHKGFDTWRSGLEASASWPVTDTYTLDLTLGWAFVNTTEDGLLPTDIGETVYQNPYLIFNQRWDHRDSAVLPTKGWHFETPLELGATIGDFSTTYLKPGFAGSWHHSFGKDGQLSIGARGGLLIPGGDTRAFPIELRYFNGGARSVRSFPERELGPRSVTNYPVGGEAMWVTNVEYVRPILGSLKGVVFVDAGGLSEHWRDFDEPEVAAGLGIRFDLPVGPVRLEYGHNLTRDPGEPSGSWHFAIGTAF